MSWKYFGAVAAAVVLTLSGCSGSGDDSAQSATGDSAAGQSNVDSSQSDDAAAKSGLLKTTFNRALSAKDLHDSVADGHLNVEADRLHIQLPGTFTRQDDVHAAQIAVWASKDHKQSAVLSVAGTSGVAADGKEYLHYLQDSALTAGYDIKYVGDVPFGSVSAKEFRLTGSDKVIGLFAFEYKGISYELTLRAADEASLDAIRSAAIETVIDKETRSEVTIIDDGKRGNDYRDSDDDRDNDDRDNNTRGNNTRGNDNGDKNAGDKNDGDKNTSNSTVNSNDNHDTGVADNTTGTTPGSGVAENSSSENGPSENGPSENNTGDKDSSEGTGNN